MAIEHDERIMITNMARHFIERLTQELTSAELEDVRHLNDEEMAKGSPVCHSHDYLDANELMEEAFLKCTPHRELDPRNSEHTRLFNAAWSLARVLRFDLSSKAS